MDFAYDFSGCNFAVTSGNGASPGPTVYSGTLTTNWVSSGMTTGGYVTYPYQFSHYHQVADDAFTRTRELFSGSGNFPPLNCHQDKKGSLILEFALAGYNKKNVEVTFEGDTLVLTSDGVDREDLKKMREIKRGIRSSKFELKYSLAEQRFNTDKATAEFEDGILKITLPLKDDKKPKVLEIK